VNKNKLQTPDTSLSAATNTFISTLQ